MKQACSAVLALIFVLSSAPRTCAQVIKSRGGSAANPTLKLKSTVRRVVIDVVVKDEQGRSVTGLTPSDFTVSEDGKPQTIRSFERHEAPAPTTEVEPLQLPPHTFTNFSTAPENGATNVILLDLLNTDLESQMQAYQGVQRFAEAMPKRSRVGLFVLRDELYLVQGVTEDRTQLLAAVKRHKAWPYLSTLDGVPEQKLRVTIKSYMEVAQFLGKIPGRKNLIWLSSDFFLPVIPSLTDLMMRQGLSKPGVRESRDDIPDATQYSNDLRQLTATLVAAQVAIYPVDVRGLQTPVNPLMEGAKKLPEQKPGELNPVTKELFGFGTAEATMKVTMDMVAQESGGRAFYNENRPNLAVADSVADGSSYYTISYSPTNTRFDGGVRKIHVECAKRGYQLSYRRSYVAEEIAGSADESIPGEPLLSAMQHGSPEKHELVFIVHVEPVGAPVMATAEQMDRLAYFESARLELGFKYESRIKKWQKREKKNPGQPELVLPPPKPVELQRYTIDYSLPYQSLSLPIAKDGKRRAAIDFAIIGYDEKGHKVTGLKGEVRDIVTQERLAEIKEKGYQVRQEIDVPVKATALQMAVRDSFGKRIGTLEVGLPLE